MNHEPLEAMSAAMTANVGTMMAWMVVRMAERACPLNSPTGNFAVDVARYHRWATSFAPVAAGMREMLDPLPIYR